MRMAGTPPDSDADKLEKLAQTYNPMEDGCWTPWQAFAWIRHLDKDKVRECSKPWLMLRPGWGFEDFWGDVSCNYEAIRVWNKGFMRALQSGRVPSSGIDAATGNRCDIDALKWLDLQLYQICCEPLGFVSSRELGEISVITDWLDHQLADSVPPAKAGPQFYHKNKRFDGLTLPEPDFREVLVRVADVLKEFPPTGNKIQAGRGAGALPAADWPAIEEALNQEIDAVGLPRRDGVPGWRTTADVISWVEKLTGTDEPGKSALKYHVAKMLKSAEERKAGN